MTVLTERFARAVSYTLQKHQHHTRKQSEVPYFTHLMGVSSVVLEYGGNEDQAIAGLLHDTLEDISGDLAEEIKKRFGQKVLEVVLGCTDASREQRDLMGRKASWYDRKEGIIAGLATKPEDVLLVAVADKYHNARNLLENTLVLGDAFWERFNAGKSPTLWYYRRLTETLLSLPAKGQGIMHLIQVFFHITRDLEQVNGVSEIPTEQLKVPLED
ncbi:HD domain-containing protein [Deinococcus cellulosilyticus]|uniref:HD/PDEase domain-containing protein n=1 Tax=Deinococcus cellulosilyticus (strain DSM 18568 / NBRC 106333 / KACC 11606 / 5516J-15) TaxID=1223518 RepID=A0A511N1R5_DEIC1|nr:HD domain-containing protein [Deinococcus cellulosilyticus]GEM46391.1 hypothetical protein DC3_20260 [Deinococcus cellulosilyticus NBRC 106333 = KACC 11606]